MRAQGPLEDRTSPTSPASSRPATRCPDGASQAWEPNLSSRTLPGSRALRAAPGRHARDRSEVGGHRCPACPWPMVHMVHHVGAREGQRCGKVAAVKRWGWRLGRCALRWIRLRIRSYRSAPPRAPSLPVFPPLDRHHPSPRSPSCAVSAADQRSAFPCRSPARCPALGRRRIGLPGRRVAPPIVVRKQPSERGTVLGLAAARGSSVSPRTRRWDRRESRAARCGRRPPRRCCRRTRRPGPARGAAPGRAGRSAPGRPRRGGASPW